MSLLSQIKELRTERKTVCDQAGEILRKAAKEKRSLSSEERQEFNNRHNSADALEQRIDQLQKQFDLETKLGQVREDRRIAGREDILPPGIDARSMGVMSKEQRDATRRYLLMGERGLDATEQRTYMQAFNETRALSAISGGAGGYTIPTGFVFTLDVALKYYGGIIDVAQYLTITRSSGAHVESVLIWPVKAAASQTCGMPCIS